MLDSPPPGRISAGHAYERPRALIFKSVTFFEAQLDTPMLCIFSPRYICSAIQPRSDRPGDSPDGCVTGGPWGTLPPALSAAGPASGLNFTTTGPLGPINVIESVPTALISIKSPAGTVRVTPL